MKVIGFRCGKDQLQWTVLEGDTRDAVSLLDHGQPSAPAGDRPEQLAWVRREVLEVLSRHEPDQATVRVAEVGGRGAPSLGRAEVEGVVQAALSEAGVPVRRLHSATLRSVFGVKTKAALESATESHPCVAAMAKVRREVVVAALAGVPA